MIELARPAGTDPLPRFREFVSVEFCRELERENAKLRIRNDQLAGDIHRITKIYAWALDHSMGKEEEAS